MMTATITLDPADHAKLVKALDKLGLSATFALDTAGEDFKRYASRYGLQATDLGRSFTQRRSTFTIVGLVPSRPKYPILVENQNGKRYKFPASKVAALLPPQ
jgi:hypothetical protein